MPLVTFFDAGSIDELQIDGDAARGVLERRAGAAQVSPPDGTLYCGLSWRIGTSYDSVMPR